MAGPICVHNVEGYCAQCVLRPGIPSAGSLVYGRVVGGSPFTGDLLGEYQAPPPLATAAEVAALRAEVARLTEVVKGLEAPAAKWNARHAMAFQMAPSMREVELEALGHLAALSCVCDSHEERACVSCRAKEALGSHP